ncbi:MAG: tyrosine-type recombinase/integrase [Clostridia bacterium]|nr:tyrosine-type recombinase/integrase [Clostridia bacterium]
MVYKQWCSEWLNCYVKPQVKERTYAKYVSMLNRHILPVIGEYHMNELTTSTLQQFVNNLQDEGYASATIHGLISLVKLSLVKAVELDVVDKEYSNYLARPKTQAKRVECFSLQEQRKLENYIVCVDKPRYFGIMLTLYTGMRIGELLALEWSDIDVKRGTIRVIKSCHDSWNNGVYVKVIDTPKTHNSQRTIPIPKQLIPYLKTMRRNSKCKYVIPGKSSLYGAQVRTYQRFFENLLASLGITHKGFHSLRHTFATRAVECGMDVKTLSEILGHANPTITLNRYAHSMFDHKTTMMNKVGRLLRR